jgi:hypothetical protein
MSDQFLSTAQVNQYHDNILHLLEQKGGVLPPYTRNESQASVKQFYEQIGSVAATQVTVRFAESPQTNTPHARRMVTIAPYHVGDYIDNFERVQTLIDPSSAYVQNFVRALGREQDRVIYQAFFSTAYTGVDGTTTEDYSNSTAPLSTADPAGPVVDVDFGSANSGLTVEKLIEADRVKGFMHWPMDEQCYLLYNSAGKADLLNTTEITSADFATVKALVGGSIDSFMGFKFIQWEGYVLEGVNVMLSATEHDSGSDDVFRYPFWQKSSLLFARGMGVQTEITRRADRSFHWYAYARAMFGATRMELNRIGMIERWISA